MILPTISIRQPWARAIVEGIKDVENRTWACPSKYIGQTVFIHASKAPVHDDEETSPVLNAVLHAKLRRKHHCQDLMQGGVLYDFKRHLALHIGGIVGMVTITGCVRDSSSSWATPGAFHWLLADALCLDFHPCKGRLGFFQTEYPY